MTPPADLPQRLGCSTISFQHLPLEGALAESPDDPMALKFLEMLRYKVN